MESLIANYGGSEHGGKTVLFIDEFDASVFASLVEFVHTGTVHFHADTVVGKKFVSCNLESCLFTGVMNAADYYGLDDLRQAAYEHAHTCVTLENVCSLLTTAERYIHYKTTKMFMQKVD